jgi:hypothetical protein
LPEIGDAASNEPLDQRDHLGDVLGGLGIDVRRQDAERRHVLALGGDVALGDLGGGDARVVGASDDAIVHIGVVAHERHPVSLELQIAAEHVEDERAARMADVGGVVDGDAAHVHADLARMKRHQLVLAARHRVVDLHEASRPPR